MKALFIYTKWLTSVGVILLIVIVGIRGIACFSHQDKSSVTEEYSLLRANKGNEGATHILNLYISSNEFSGTDQDGKNETLNQVFCSPLYAYKLIRSSLFDDEHSLFLSQKLTWYTQSTYMLRLSPFWQPSIPIAHRKLII